MTIESSVLALEKNVEANHRYASEKDKACIIGDYFSAIYSRIHKHYNSSDYDLVENKHVDRSWDAIEKSGVSPELLSVCEILGRFGSSLGKREHSNCPSWHKHGRLVKDASKKFKERAEKHFGKLFKNSVRDTYRTAILDRAINPSLEGKVGYGVGYGTPMELFAYLYGGLNEEIPKLVEINDLIQKVYEKYADQKSYPTKRESKEGWGYCYYLEISDSERVKVDYQFDLAVKLYRLTMIEPKRQTIETMIKDGIRGAKYLYRMKSIGEIHHNCRMRLVIPNSIDDIFGGICTDLLNDS